MAPKVSSYTGMEQTFENLLHQLDVITKKLFHYRKSHSAFPLALEQEEFKKQETSRGWQKIRDGKSNGQTPCKHDSEVKIIVRAIYYTVLRIFRDEDIHCGALKMFTRNTKKSFLNQKVLKGKQ